MSPDELKHFKKINSERADYKGLKITIHVTIYIAMND
jgi:hypothetical protein